MLSRRSRNGSGKSYTHAELVDVAREWLCRKHAIVMTELTTGNPECADAVGFHSFGNTTLIECKASRSDFMADRKKIHRQMPEVGIGLHRYFLAPAKLLVADELPGGWGLLEWNGHTVRVIQSPIPFETRNHNGERMMLVSALRRLGQRTSTGINIQCYTVKRATRFSEPKNRATLSVLEGE